MKMSSFVEQAFILIYTKIGIVYCITVNHQKKKKQYVCDFILEL